MHDLPCCSYAVAMSQTAVLWMAARMLVPYALCTHSSIHRHILVILLCVRVLTFGVT